MERTVCQQYMYNRVFQPLPNFAQRKSYISYSKKDDNRIFPAQNLDLSINGKTLFTLGNILVKTNFAIKMF